MRQKGNSHGATLLLSLLFFIFCAVVGSVILTAATAASGRLAGLARQEEDYYVVTSAAQYLASLLEETQVVIRNTGTEDQPVLELTDCTGNELPEKQNNLLLDAGSGSSGGSLEELYLYLQGKSTQYQETEQYFLLQPGSTQDSTVSSYPAVVSYRLQKDFSVIFQVYAPEKTDGTNSYKIADTSYHVTVTVPARVNPDTDGTADGRYQIYWDQAEITRSS